MAKRKGQTIEITEEQSNEEVVKAIENFGGKIAESLQSLNPAKFISTGMLSLDRAISKTKGIPGNCCIEVYGQNSTGKTSFALQCASYAQAAGFSVYYINAENAINEDVINCFPLLNGNNVKWIDVPTGEKALDIMLYILKTQPNSFIINDSVPACLPSQVQENSSGEVTVGALARLFSPFMPQAKKYCKLNNSVLLQLNQIRHKIGPMTRGGEDTPGGESIKFYSDLRIQLKRRYPNPEIKVGGELVGHYVAATVVKTRFNAPFWTAEIPLIYGAGFDEYRELLDYGASVGVIKLSGSWVYYNEQKLGQGIENSCSTLRQDSELKEKIKKEILEIIS